METIAELSRERNIPVHMHVAESLGELKTVREKYGTTSIRALKKLGLLNSRLLCAHCFYVD